MSQEVYKNEKYQVLWIFLSIFGVTIIFICAAILCTMVLWLPPGSSPWYGAGDYNQATGHWTNPGGGPTPSDLKAFYPERFGLYDVNVTFDQEDILISQFWINKEAIVAIVFLSIATINSAFMIIFIRPKIKAWFRLSTFNRVTIILEIVCVLLLVIGLVGSPQNDVNSLNEEWQKGKDVDWANLIFNHDPYMDTTWGAAQAEATGKMYSYTIVGLITLVFVLIFIIWCVIDTLFGFVITINRYRSWKRYQRIEEL